MDNWNTKLYEKEFLTVSKIVFMDKRIYAHTKKSVGKNVIFCFFLSQSAFSSSAIHACMNILLSIY